MSKVKKITVSNLKAVSSLTADFNGCTAIITGGNNKGKSSFLKSLPERLRGVKPSMILKEGEKEGFAEWELTTGEKFTWNFDGKKEKLAFTTERNIKTAITKDLSSYYFPPVFDVDEFLNSTPKKQKETLQKLTGIDFTEIDLMYKAAYEERTWANKKLAEEKAKLIQVDPLLPPEITPTIELEKELAGIDAHNQGVKNKTDLVEQKNKALSDNELEILQLKERIKIIEQKNSLLNSELLELDVWLDEEENQLKTNARELEEKITKIKEENKAVEENKKAADQKLVYEKCVLEAERLDKEVKKIEQEKLDVIKNASMPDGFGFSDEGITYKGFAFTKDQLSSSGIYIAALKLAAIGLGEVKTLHFDASFLDKQSLCEIEQWAHENDLQLLIERPAFEGGEIEYQILQA
jgi:outer membrane murein-binding lipoprotein Lpp